MLNSSNDTSGQRPQPAGVWTPSRQELRDWLRETAPSLAPAFEGAVELLGTPLFPGRIHFIAHAVRDIANRLVYCLDDDLEESRVEYFNLVDGVADDWPMLDGVFRDSEPGGENRITIEYGTARKIDALVTEHKNRKAAPSNEELLFRRLTQNERPNAAVAQRLVSTFKETRRWFMALAHLRRDRAPVIDEDELQSQFQAFEKMVHSFVGSFFTGTQELDAILQQANR